MGRLHRPPAVTALVRLQSTAVPGRKRHRDTAQMRVYPLGNTPWGGVNGCALVLCGWSLHKEHQDGSAEQRGGHKDERTARLGTAAEDTDDVRTGKAAQCTKCVDGTHRRPCDVGWQEFWDERKVRPVGRIHRASGDDQQDERYDEIRRAHGV